MKKRNLLIAPVALGLAVALAACSQPVESTGAPSASPAGTWSVEVESALARDLVGQTLVRNYDVTDDTLVLTPVDASEGWRVTYERASE